MLGRKTSTMDSRKRHISISLPDDSLEAKKALWELLTMNEPVLSDVSSLDDESTDDESLLVSFVNELIVNILK